MRNTAVASPLFGSKHGLVGAVNEMIKQSRRFCPFGYTKTDGDRNFNIGMRNGNCLALLANSICPIPGSFFVTAGQYRTKFLAAVPANHIGGSGKTAQNGGEFI